MSLEIKLLKPPFTSEVSQLFQEEYGTSMAEFGSKFSDFFCHSFQNNRSLILAALDNGTIVGLQSYFYWPLEYQGIVLNSYQSGNSIIRKDQRGKGIFNSLLVASDKILKEVNVDLAIGFPTVYSNRAFLRNNWTHLFNLSWYIKFCNPLNFFNIFTNSKFEKMSLSREEDFSKSRNNSFTMANGTEFLEWRQNYQKQTNYFEFRVKGKGSDVLFYLKRKKYKKIFNNLIIGDILFNGKFSAADLLFSLNKLIDIASPYYSNQFISIAINEFHRPELGNLLIELGFFKVNKSIPFIFKKYNSSFNFNDPGSWNIMATCLDTW
jgi:hypothetical protein